MERCLASLPRGLRPLYGRLLTQIDEEDRPVCDRILKWIAQAARLLTLGELAEAMDISGSEHIPQDQAVNDRTTWCGSLLRCDTHQGENSPSLVTVSLVHYSLKQYLFDITHAPQWSIANLPFDSEKTHYDQCNSPPQEAGHTLVHAEHMRRVHRNLTLH
jgi:hypothetical protein